jgi:IS30 family transposase
MKKNDDRKSAEKLFLSEKGRITNKELAVKLDVHPATVARWKKIDEWDLKLVQAVVSHEEEWPEETDDSYAVDRRHLKALNDRIDTYLQRKDLVPSEITQLAQAKHYIMSCMELIYDNVRYPVMDDIDHGEEDFE